MAQNHNAKHPWYEKREDVWAFNKDHYDGGRTLVESVNVAEYLPAFRVEEDASYDDRKKRSKGLYDNIVKRAISVYTSQVYGVDPVRKLPSQMEELLGNVDLHGTNANPFFLYRMEMAERDGISFILIDAPRAAKQAEAEGDDGAGAASGSKAMPKPGMTEFERREQNLRPWFEGIDASQVIDWDVERDDTTRLGELNWVVIKDEIQRKAEPFAKIEKVTRFRVWTRKDWSIYEEIAGATDGSGEEIGAINVDKGPNELGEVPLVAVYAKRIGPMKGETIIDEVALTCNAIWNRSSVEDESFHIHGFPQVVFKMGEGRDITQLKLAADRGIQIGTDDDAFYLEPPSYSLEAFEKFIERSVERITDLVFARTSRQLRTKQVQTAEGKNIDRKEFTSLLKTKAGYAEDSELKCWQLAAMLFGGKEDDVEIEYNRDFDVDDETAAEWEKLVTNHVRSRVEWYISEHPGTTEDDALEAIAENREVEMERSVEQMNLAFEQAVAEGRNLPDNGPEMDREGRTIPPGANGKDGKAGKKKTPRKKASSRRSRRRGRKDAEIVGGEEGAVA